MKSKKPDTRGPFAPLLPPLSACLPPRTTVTFIARVTAPMLLLAASCFVGGCGDPEAAGEGAASVVDGKFLLAFHGCDPARSSDCGNFEEHETYLAQCHETALDGCTGDAWQLVPGWTAYRGSVPDVVRRGDTLYIFTPGRVRRVSAIDGSVLGEENANIAGTAANGGSGWVDPSPTIDDEGRLVLVFLYCVEPGTDTGTMCFGGAGAEPDRRIGSAVEVEGSDGAAFTLDATPRLKCTDAGVPSCTDPDVFFDGSQWILYVATGPRIAMFAADSLHGAYATLGAGELWNAQGGPGVAVPSGHFDGSYFTFGHSSGMGATTIRRAIHPALAPLAASDWTLMLEATDLGLPATTNLESPGITPNTR